MERPGESTSGGRTSQCEGLEAGGRLVLEEQQGGQVWLSEGERGRRGKERRSAWGQRQTMQGFVGCKEDFGLCSKKNRKEALEGYKWGSDVA